MCIQPNNSTPLHLAVFNGHDAVAKLLLEHGCDASVEDVVTHSHCSSKLLAAAPLAVSQCPDTSLIAVRDEPTRMGGA